MKSTPRLSEIVWVAFGGMIGASMRHVTNLLVAYASDGPVLFTATAIENIIGCFLIGLIFTLLKKRADKSRQMSLFLLTGIIGSYTTYSGFMAEALTLSGISLLMMGVYLFSQIIIGIFAVMAGIYVARKSWNFGQ